ncbi:MAG: hypothetical protein WCX60_03565 [Anaerovoracaceae bacterium]
MLCGVKFCGGCNPRFERGKALEELKRHFADRIEFAHAQEGTVYDVLLVIGGCTNCCASYCEYETRKGNIKLWDGSHVERIIDELEQMLKTYNK